MVNSELNNIEYNVVYSSRRTLGISVRRDSSVVIRVPYGTSGNTIKKLLYEKRKWILKHAAWFRDNPTGPSRKYTEGEKHFFRGRHLVLRFRHSEKSFCIFNDEHIDIGSRTNSPDQIRKILFTGYKREALSLFPGMLAAVISNHKDKNLEPAGLRIRTMKSRWGSCSRTGVITLNSDLVRLNDTCIKYVMIHELCHLKHHDHGKGFYHLLSAVCPDWKRLKSEIRNYSAW